jgi:hypothetical protein
MRAIDLPLKLLHAGAPSAYLGQLIGLRRFPVDRGLRAIPRGESAVVSGFSAFLGGSGAIVTRPRAIGRRPDAIVGRPEMVGSSRAG